MSTATDYSKNLKMEAEICFETLEFTKIHYVILFAVVLKGRRKKRHNGRKNNEEIVRGRRETQKKGKEDKQGRMEGNEKDGWNERRKSRK